MVTRTATHAARVGEAPPHARTISSQGVGRRTIARSFEVTPRRIMAYAAAIGDSNPAYFDDAGSGGLIGHPCMAFSFQWNSRHRPDLLIDPRIAVYGVHAGTDLRLTRPFAEGDVITCQGEIIAAHQIRPGVRQVDRYTMRDSTGEVVAELDMASVTRGAKLEGPEAAIAEEQAVPRATDVEAAALWSVEVEIAPQAAQVYTECAEIYNPIHTERRVALAAGLPDIILHGSATQAIAVREIVDHALGRDPSRVVRMVGHLRAMVLLGTTITIRCIEDRPGPAGGREIFFDVTNAEGARAVAGGVVLSRPD